MHEPSLQDERFFRRLAQEAPDIIAILKADSTVRYVSPAIERVLGLRPEDIMESRISEYLHPEESEWALENLVKKFDPGSISRPVEFRMRHADSSWRCFEAISVNLLEDPGMRSIVAYMRDITERKTREEELVHRALHDSLTGTANRSLFMDRLEHALARAVRRDGPVVVLYLDLDNFKAINDSFGHETGDRVLTAVSQRLQACLRPGDTVARLGGDEFAVLLEDTPGVEYATYIAERIVEVLRAPITYADHMIYVTASIGIASSGPGLDRAEDLLSAADLAMYQAKEKGKAQHKVLEKSMSIEDLERLRMENELRQAVERGELRAYYQPEVLLETREIIGMEALLRWERPSLGLISPSEFVALAEENGLIVPIGQWILKEACRQALLWQEQYPDSPLLISVNLSLRQFRQPALTETVAAILEETGLDPGSLVLEVTEGLAMEDTEHVLDTIWGLKALGVKLAIDDFGAAYSSLSNIEKFPVDFLKVDQSFIDKLGRGNGNIVVLVSMLIDLAQALGIKVVAEGVENAEQLEKLRQMECDLAQGYYFWEPLTSHAASDLLKSYQGV